MVITKEMEEEEKQLMEEGEREEQEMMIKVCRSLIKLISPSAYPSGALLNVRVLTKLGFVFFHKIVRN